MNLGCSFWLGKLANLNVARTPGRGIAPHKPLMLLSVIDLIESGDFSERWIPYGVLLVSKFRSYWDLVLERQQNRPDITMPFNALGGERDAIWERFTAEGEPSKSKLTTRLCRLDPDLFLCLQSDAFRRKARTTLVAIYFPAREQIMLSARLGLPMPDTAEVDALKKDGAAFRASQKKGRDSAFRDKVTSSYHFTCALTGYRLETTDGYLVEAAHIHQHAKSANDDPRNGLALTPDAHWMFDAGLWTASPKGDHFIVTIAKGRFQEGSVDDRTLLDRNDVPLVFHKNARLRPGAEFLAWHRGNKFLNSK